MELWVVIAAMVVALASAGVTAAGLIAARRARKQAAADVAGAEAARIEAESGRLSAEAERDVARSALESAERGARDTNAYAEELARRLDHSEAQRETLHRTVTEIGDPLLHALSAMGAAEREFVALLVTHLPAEDIGRSALAHMEMRSRIAEMRRVWLSADARDNRWEDRCGDLLAENLWLLQPDYVVEGRVFKRCGLATVVRGLFGRFWSKTFRHPPDTGIRPDLVTLARTADSFHARRGDAPALLLLELKSPSQTIDIAAMEQALSYAYDAFKLIHPDDCVQIECLAIGGDVAEGVETMTMRWKDTHDRTVRVVPLSWSDLVKRAERLIHVQRPALDIREDKLAAE